MATEKQIAANRANAKRSTGPRTAAGKQKSSRNAFRHGLSCLEAVGSSPATELQVLVDALAGEQASPERLAAATEFACAQAQLVRIQAIRTEHWAKINLDDGPGGMKNLKQLASLDQYDRYAFTRRRRASKGLN